MKYTYMMEPEKIGEELEILWNKYQSIINQDKPSWNDVNEARAILFLTGNLYCEEIAVEAIRRRLHLLPEQISLIDFFMIIDSQSEKLEHLRKNFMFNKLERFYTVIRNYKNKYIKGKYYLEEEEFLKKYQQVNPNPDLKIGYQGSF